jgi:hypothetical protein
MKSARKTPPTTKAISIRVDTQPFVGPSMTPKTIPPIASRDKRAPTGSKLDSSGAEDSGRNTEHRTKIANDSKAITIKTDPHQ